MSVQNFMAIHPEIDETFQSGPKIQNDATKTEVAG